MGRDEAVVGNVESRGMLRHVEERSSDMVWECVLKRGWGRDRAMEAHDGWCSVPGPDFY